MRFDRVGDSKFVIAVNEQDLTNMGVPAGLISSGRIFHNVDFLYPFIVDVLADNGVEMGVAASLSVTAVASEDGDLVFAIEVHRLARPEPFSYSEFGGHYVSVAEPEDAEEEEEEEESQPEFLSGCGTPGCPRCGGQKQFRNPKVPAVVFRFRDIEDFISMTQGLLGCVLVPNSLYHYDNAYYLVLHSSGKLASKYVPHILEFSEKSGRTKVFLDDYGKLIKGKNAIKMFQSKFIKSGVE